MTEWRQASPERYLGPLRKKSRESYEDNALERALFTPKGKAYPLVMFTAIVWPDGSGSIKIGVDTKTNKGAWWSNHEGIPPELFPEFVAFTSRTAEAISKMRSRNDPV